MFLPIAGKVVGRAVADGHLKKDSSVVEMGNQTYSLSASSVNETISYIRDGKPLLSVDFKKLSELSFKSAGKRPGDPAAPLVSEFFTAMGFSSYTAIDINEKFGSVIMDLNKDLQNIYDYKETYDLVTNIGVSEHLFDQATFFKNAHRLTKKNGLMLHILPFEGYVNHGFYNYQPRFFIDLAEANEYEFVHFFACGRENPVLDLRNWNEIGAYFYQNLNLLAENLEGSLFVLALLRKKNDAEFVYPLQGKYMKDIGSQDFKKNYDLQTYKNLNVPVATKSLFLAKKDSTFLEKLRRKIKKKLINFLTILQRFILLKL